MSKRKGTFLGDAPTKRLRELDCAHERTAGVSGHDDKGIETFEPNTNGPGTALMAQDAMSSPSFAPSLVATVKGAGAAASSSEMLVGTTPTRPTLEGPANNEAIRQEAIRRQKKAAWQEAIRQKEAIRREKEAIRQKEAIRREKEAIRQKEAIRREKEAIRQEEAIQQFDAQAKHWEAQFPQSLYEQSVLQYKHATNEDLSALCDSNGPYRRLSVLLDTKKLKDAHERIARKAHPGTAWHCFQKLQILAKKARGHAGTNETFRFLLEEDPFTEHGHAANKLYYEEALQSLIDDGFDINAPQKFARNVYYAMTPMHMALAWRNHVISPGMLIALANRKELCTNWVTVGEVFVNRYKKFRPSDVAISIIERCQPDDLERHLSFGLWLLRHDVHRAEVAQVVEHCIRKSISGFFRGLNVFALRSEKGIDQHLFGQAIRRYCDFRIMVSTFLRGRGFPPELVGLMCGYLEALGSTLPDNTLVPKVDPVVPKDNPTTAIVKDNPTAKVNPLFAKDNPHNPLF